MAILPLLSLYNYDPSIFEGLHVPTVSDLDPALEYVDNFKPLSDADLIAELLAEIGEMTPVYPDTDILKQFITIWAKIEKPVWTKLWQTTIFKYNPIWNKDGTYKEKRSGSSSGNNTTTYGRTDTHSVTGFDTNAFSPSEKDEAGGTDKGSSGASYTDTLERTESGNIGVTTTQAMLKEEREAAAFNIYSYIIDAFKKRFCIMIY